MQCIMYGRKRNQRPKARKPLRKYSRRPRARAPLRKVKTMVKKMISRQEEKKQIVFASTTYPSCLQQSTSSIAGNYLVLTPANSTYGPSIARGTANNQIIGNKMQIVRYIHTVALTPTAYNSTTNTQVTPCFVRLYYFKSKAYPCQDQGANSFNQYGNFFENGSQDIGFYGSLMDLTRKIQNQNFTYLTHRTFKIGNNAPPITSSNTPSPILSNNDFKLSVVAKIDLTRFFKKPIIYNDAGNLQTPWVFCIIQVVGANGAIFATSQLPIQCQNEMHMWYTDA